MALHVAEQVGHLFGTGVFDFCEFLPDGCCSLAVAADGVHAEFIQVRYFIGVRTFGGICGGKAGHNPAHTMLAGVAEDVE